MRLLPQFSRRSANRRRGGFTLMELLFAAGAFAIIALVLKTTLAGVMGMKTDAQSRSDVRTPRMRARDVMLRDLKGMTSHVTNRLDVLVSDISGSGGASRGSIEFYTTTGNLRETDRQIWGETQFVRWELLDPLIEDSPNPYGFDLARGIQRNVATEVRESNWEYQRFVTGAHSLEFEFFDGEQWRDSWDSADSDIEGLAPALVRARIRFLPRDREQGRALLSQTPNPLYMQPLDVIEVVAPVAYTPPTEEEEEGETE